jgi:hypothetical protein
LPSSRGDAERRLGPPDCRGLPDDQFRAAPAGS